MDKKSVVLINDKANFNVRYRSTLMRSLIESGYEVENVGFFDGFKSFFLAFVFLFRRKKLIISSNLRSNLLVLLVPWKHALIILNGLGRWRKFKSFRIFLLILLSINNKTALVQNFADYRYIRRYANANLVWLPGSGGSVRDIGSNDDFLVVTRPEKLRYIFDSTLDFCRLYPKKTVYVIGCSADEVSKLAESLCVSLNLKGLGYVDQGNLFKAGRSFIQPDGYGEGIPHSLIDALSSGMRCYIPRIAYVRFGLRLLGFQWIPTGNGWGEINASFEAKKNISNSHVNQLITDCLMLKR